MIKTHKELAEHIAGKRILHMNSLGKDSAVVLEWLVNYAAPASITSVYFQRLVEHPDDKRYLRYQQKRYPSVEFRTEPNGNELTDFPAGIYASPIAQLCEHNRWEYIEFRMREQAENLRCNLACDFIASGFSRYESVARATKFEKLGLLQGNTIYPIGNFTKAQVIASIKASGVKLHPIYKVAQSTLDHLTYYKMRSSFIIHPSYKEVAYRYFPLLALDEYRWEKLF